MSNPENSTDGYTPVHRAELAGRNGNARKSGVWLSVATRGGRSTYHATLGPLVIALLILVLGVLFGALVLILLGAALIWFLLAVMFVVVAAFAALSRGTNTRPR